MARALASLAMLLDPIRAGTTRSAFDHAMDAAAYALGFDAWWIVTGKIDAGDPLLAPSQLAWLDRPLRDAIIDLAVRLNDATQVATTFADITRTIAAAPTDHALLAAVRTRGLHSGIIVPAGHGSALVMARNNPGAASNNVMLNAQVLAPFAVEAARRQTSVTLPRRPILTPRQRECLLWAARGKTDWEIAVILGVTKETVDSHIDQARERYGVDKRSTLIVRALFDGTISFEEVLRGAYSPFPG